MTQGILWEKWFNFAFELKSSNQLSQLKQMKNCLDFLMHIMERLWAHYDEWFGY